VRQKAEGRGVAGAYAAGWGWRGALSALTYSLATPIPTPPRKGEGKHWVNAP